MKKAALITAALAGALFLGVPPALALVIFQDTFDTEGAPGVSVLNYNAFANWDVTRGSVDLIANGDFGITCAGGAGKCVDLDGSTFAAGKMETKITFAPGEYILMFDISGNQRGGPSNTLIVSLGTFIETFVRFSGDPFGTITRNVTVTSASKLIFDHLGGNNIGIILDNVSLQTPVAGVPEPSTLLLLAAGLGTLSSAAWRRR